MCKLYFQCDRGAAGDMISAALIGLVQDQKKTLTRLNHIGIPGTEFIYEKRERYGIEGNAMTVKVHGETEEDAAEEMHHAHHKQHAHHHIHMTMGEINEIVDHMNTSGKVKQDVKNIYRILADAESKAHGCPVSEVHFHEVGALDAIADITAVCMLVEELKPEKIVASKVHVGNGTVKCAHGILPVPAPATANILENIPYENGKINGEICTPTAAAVVKYFVDDYIEEKPEKIKGEKIGIGIGKKIFSEPSYFAAWRVQ